MKLIFLCTCPLQIRAIENEIDLGQIEEVIEMVKDEMESIDNYVGRFNLWLGCACNFVGYVPLHDSYR